MGDELRAKNGPDRTGFAAVAVAAALANVWLAGPPARAQDHGETLRQCYDSAPDIAVRMCTSLIESGANTDAARSELIWRRANAYHRRGDTAHALADLNEAIRLNPRRPELYESRSFVFVMMGDAEAAVADADRAARRRRGRPEAANARCWGRALAGLELDAARRACDAALRLRPGAGGFLDSRGLVGLKQGRFQDAWNDYNEALRWAPEQAHYLYGRGIAALRLGRAADGEADIAAALKIDPAIADRYATYGIAR